MLELVHYLSNENEIKTRISGKKVLNDIFSKSKGAVHSKMRIFNVRAENVQKYPKNAELRIIDGNQLKPNRTRDDVGDKLGQYDRQQDCSESANRAF